MIRLLLFVVLAASSVLSGQQPRSIEFRVLCLEHRDGITEAYLASAGSGAGGSKIPLLTSGSSEVIQGGFAGTHATLVAGSEPDAKPVATGPLAKSARQWFLLVPSGGKDAPYQIQAFDDDLTSFPAGRVRAVNLSPVAVRYTIAGEKGVQLSPGKSALLPLPSKTDDYGLYPVLIEFQSGDGKWVRAQQTSWKALKDLRETVVTLVDASTRQPAVRKFRDTPPW